MMFAPAWRRYCWDRKQLLAGGKQKVWAQAKCYAYGFKQLLELDLLLDKQLLVLEAIACKQLLLFMHTAQYLEEPILYSSWNLTNLNRLHRLQKKPVRIICHFPFRSHTCSSFKKLDILNIILICTTTMFLVINIMYSCLKKFLPIPLIINAL